MDDRATELNLAVANRVMKWGEWVCEDCGDGTGASWGWSNRHAFPNPLALPHVTGWNPSTDANDDYAVLVKVRETWCNVEEADKPENCCENWRNNYRALRSRFFDALARAWRDRDDKGGWIEWEGQYIPGDFSRAALVALRIKQPAATLPRKEESN